MKTRGRTSKTIAAFLLSFAMLAGLFPVGAFAAEDAGTQGNVQISDELSDKVEEVFAQQAEAAEETPGQEADPVAEETVEAEDPAETKLEDAETPAETEQEDAEVPAEEENPEEDLLGDAPVACVIGKNGTTTNYTDFKAAIEAWNNAGNGATLKLLDDLEISENLYTIEDWNIGYLDMFVIMVSGGSAEDPMILDLNDHGILLHQEKYRYTGFDMIHMEDNAHLCLTDSSNKKTVRYITIEDSEEVIFNRKMVMSISKTVPAAGTEYFKVEGGYLTGGRSCGGNAIIAVGESGSFTMNGGSLCGNYTDWSPIGTHEGSFIMNGGEIHHNFSDGRGAVDCQNGTFTMNGGKIHHNESPGTGGGVCAYGGTFILNDGEISDNKASWGGGIYGGYDEIFMNGGTVTGNTAEHGGGVCIGDDSTYPSFYHMTGGKIYGNTASTAGSAFYIESLDYQNSDFLTFSGQLIAGVNPDGSNANEVSSTDAVIENISDYGYLEIIPDGAKVTFEGWSADGGYSIFINDSIEPILKGSVTAPFDEDFSFRVVPSVIKTITGVSYTKNGTVTTLAPDENGLYTIPAAAVTGNITVGVTTESVEFEVAFDEGFGTTYTIDSLTQRVNDVTGGDDFSFKPVALNGGRIRKVTVQKAGSEPVELFDEDGVYKIRAVDSNYSITVLTGSSTTHEVTFGPGFGTDYTVQSRINGVWVDNPGSKTTAYDRDDYRFRIKPVTGKTISAVTVTIDGNETGILPAAFAGNEYIIENIQKNLVINVTVAQGVMLKADPMSSEHIRLYAYDIENGKKGVLIDADNGLSVAYNSDFYVFAEADEGYDSDQISIGETVLTTAEGEEEVYKIPATLTKNNIALQATAFLLPDGLVTFDVTYADQAADHCTFSLISPDDAVQEGNTFFIDGTKTTRIKYTLEVEKGYRPVAELCSGDEHIRDVMFGTPVVSNDGETLVYTIDGKTAEYINKNLRISVTRQLYSLRAIGANIKTVTAAYLDGTQINVSSTEQDTTVFANIDPHKIVTITAVPADGYLLTGVSDGNNIALSHTNGTVVYMMQADPDGVNCIRFACEPFTVLKVAGLAVAPNATVGANDPFDTDVTMGVFVGTNQFDKSHITKVTASVSGYTPAIADDGTITIGYNDKISSSKQPVKVTVEGNDNDGKAFKFTVSLVFKKEITQFSVTGAKKNKDNVFVIEQPAGTTRDYPVKVNANAWPGDVVAEVSVPGGGECHATAGIDPAKGVLTITTAKDKSIAGNKTERYVTTNPFIVSFKSSKGAELGSVTVNPTMQGFTAPTATLTLASDRHLEFALSVPKAAEGMMNLFYQIEAAPVLKQGQSVPTTMCDGLEAYCVPADDPAAGIVFLAKDGVLKGAGAAQKYDISISVVQKESVTLDEELTVCGYDEENLSEGRAKTLKNQSTKDPAYESSLKLARKQATFTQGEKNVLVAVAKYSRQTTWTGLSSAYIVDAKGNRHSTDVLTDENGMTNIVFSETASIAAGKATLYAYPVFAAGQYASPATLPLTVKAPIDKIDITPNVTRLYKQDRKTASLKLTATPWWDGDGDKDQKPASKKVNWSIVDEEGEDLSDSDPRYGITVKNGSVTIPKEFTPTANYKTFCVKAEADDFEGNPAYTLTDPITVTTTRIYLDGVTFTDKNDKALAEKSEITAEKAYGATFRFTDNKTPVKICDLTLKVPAGLTVENKDATTFKIASITKAGKYKITATANDDGKSSYVLEFTVKASKPKYEVLGISNVYTVRPYASELLNMEAIVPTEEGQYLVNDATLFAVTVKRTDAPFSTDFSTKPTVKGGKLAGITKVVDSEGYQNWSYWFSPNKSGDMTELRFDGKSYKIINTRASESLSVAKKTSTDFPADAKEGSQFKFYFTTAANPEKVKKIRFAVNESISWSIPNAEAMEDNLFVSNYLDILTVLNDSATVFRAVEGKNGEYELTAALAGIPAGTYSYEAMLTDDAGNILTQPCTVSLKAVPVKKPSAKINEKCTLGRNVADYEVAVTLKTADFAEIELTGCLNNNDAGKINNFRSHFELSDAGYDPATKSIKLKMTTPLTKAEWDACKGKMTGWIRYNIMNENYDSGIQNPDTVVKDAVAKVVITIPKPEN